MIKNVYWAFFAGLLMTLFMGAVLADTNVAGNNYDYAIHTAQSEIKDQHYSRAESILSELNKKYTNNQEVISILIRVQCVMHEFEKVDQTLRNSNYGIPQPDLKRALQFCAEERLFSNAQRLLAAGDAVGAIQIAQSLYPSGPDPYRAGLILAKAYVVNHQDANAAAIYTQLAKKYPKDTNLATQALRLQTGLKLINAQKLLAAGDAASAILIAQPLYLSGPDPYGAGLILARAYVVNHQDANAAEIYTELARKYPNDADMAIQALLLNLDTGDFSEANILYQQMDIAQQKQVLADFGGSYDRLFQNSLTVEGGSGSSSGSYPDDNYSGLQLRRLTAFGTIIGEVIHAHQFGESATSYSVDYYANPIYGYEMEVAASHSPDNTFLPRDSVTIALLKNTGTYTWYASIRHSIYSDAVADVLFGGIGLQINNSLFLKTGLFYVPQVSAYSFLVAPQWVETNGNKTFVYLSAGEMGEQLAANGGILRTPSGSIKTGHMINISAQTSISGDLFYEYYAGLYNRSGFEVALTRRW